MFSKRLAGMVPEARKYVAASVALQWVALAANIALMLLMGAFVQSLVEGGDVAAARANLVMAAAAAIVVRVCCLTLSQRMGQAAAAAAKRTVRKLVYDKLVRLGPSYSERVSTSEAVQVSVEGTEQLESYFGSYLPQLFYSVLAPLTLFACLAPLCFPAAVALLACVPLIPASIVAVWKIAKRAMGSYWDAYTDLGATFLENLQGLTTLKIYRVDADRHEAMNREAETFRQATMRLLRMQLNSVTVMDVFAYGGAAVGIVMALWQFSLGQAPFFAAFAVIFLAAEFFIPLRTLGSFFHTAMNGMAAADKMFAILDAPEPKRGSRVIEADRISFACRGVGYSYDGERTVLSDVDFDAAAGSFTGIVGESGSGKSTLAGILSGRNAGFAGSVEVGGVPIQEASRASLASTVTVVPFSSYLFKGSVRSNLLLADPQASDEELWEALRRCRAEGFVEQAGGLDAAIAEEGGNLSGGQRQRLALACALLRDTPAYVFDEATSNVDAESERAIVEVVHELARTKTVVVISHRLAAVAGADRIYVLEDGRVAEAGTHGELLEHGGPYARLWSRQAELERFSAAVEADDPEDRLTEAPSAVSGGSARAAAEPARCPDCPAHGRRGEEPAPVEPTRRSHLSVMLRLVGLVRPLAPWMALAVVLGVLGFGAAIFLTVFGVYALVDLAGFPQTVGYGAALALVAVCGVARGPLRYGEQLCNHYLAFKLLALVRDRVFAALRRLAPAKLEGRDKGDLVSLVTGDIELLEVFYAHTLSPAIIAFVVSAGMTAFVATISPALGLLALASYLLVGVAVPYASSKASGMGGRELREGLGGMNAFVLDSLRGLRETLQFGRAAERSRELDERMDELARAEARLKGRGALAMSLTNGLVLALDVAMVLASGTLCLSGAIAPDGALVATAALMSSFGPVIAVANLGSTLQQTLASGGRVLELLDERPQTEEVDDGVDLGTFSGAAVRRVDFSYGGHPVLDDVSLHIEPGSVVHLAGRSGSGKSTLCKLLMRFWDATRGVVEVSGTDVRRANTASLRETQGYMTQETHLFAGTIGENILLAKPSASPEELAEACRKAALSGLIERLPRGLDTPVGELGETLSGGERQRIGLARVFLHDAPFVLLDEPTSNLDSLNEAAVLRALSEGRGDKTVVLVSHRASTAAIADVEYTVDRGRLG